ncbi:MAG TPA: N-acetylmuramoyl-L-alanine amidase [Rhodospirillaceae bacterium]|nr:N-acetylmuramoyl-L-alanine amidase [Rhodospirillaceae bacterium]
MKQTPSPNFNDRAAGAAIAYLVLHYTGMRTAQDALVRMCDPTAQVSAHYMIDEDGSVYQLVDESRRAWHAGESFWRGETDLNSLSIGVELVNKGHEFGYTPFPAVQIAGLKTLLNDIMARHALPPEALLAHSDIAPLRKEDPGELFPWQELATEGFGLWPMPTPEDRQSSTEADIITMLGNAGYDTRTPESISASRTAFLRRYHPERLGFGFDNETTARLRAQLRVMR